jgi:hypothetical protein
MRERERACGCVCVRETEIESLCVESGGVGCTCSRIRRERSAMCTFSSLLLSSLEFIDTQVYEPSIPALLTIASLSCEVLVLKSRIICTRARHEMHATRRL